MKFHWISDCHLDHVRDTNVFYDELSRVTSNEDVVLVTGDISSSSKLRSHLDEMRDASNAKVLYVIGNHDIWGSSFSSVNRQLATDCFTHEKMVFMDEVDHVALDDNTCVVGESGWYDGINGEQGNPRFIMNDWFLIQEFRNSTCSNRMLSQSIADARALKLEKKIEKAIEDGYKRLVVITHCPPHVEACRYKGQPSDHFALPWFSSRVTEDVLNGMSAQHPDVMFEVLCGHTHDAYRYQYSNNLVVNVAGAEYGKPQILPWNPSLW